MKKSFIIFVLCSLLLVSAWLLVTGATAELYAFASGLAMFCANLMLWIVIVRELIDGAAQAAEAIEHSKDKVPENLSADEPELENPRDTQKSSRSVWIFVAGMATKVVLLGGGIYLCLAVLKLTPLFFVAGLATGLGLFASIGYFFR